MRQTSSLTPREKEVLGVVVEQYIATGEPVASRSIARRTKSRVSAATVRNVMADLSDSGYLAQPHTSAGRVPTAKAFTIYIQSQLGARLMLAEMSRMRAELQNAETIEDRVGRTSRLLTEITHNIGIAAAIPAQTLDSVELLLLPDGRILMVVATTDHTVRNRVVSLSERVTQDELNSIRNYINLHFRGWQIAAVRAELRRRLDAESAFFDSILRRLAWFYDKGLLDLGETPEVHLEGASSLLGLDLHLTREKLRDLFRALEEKKRLLQLLERFLEQPDGELAVHVGLQDAHPSMGELALIGVSITLPSGLTAKLAVLGPMRMNYHRVIPAVLQAGQLFQSLPQ